MIRFGSVTEIRFGSVRLGRNVFKIRFGSVRWGNPRFGRFLVTTPVSFPTHGRYTLAGCITVFAPLVIWVMSGFHSNAHNSSKIGPKWF